MRYFFVTPATKEEKPNELQLFTHSETHLSLHCQPCLRCCFTSSSAVETTTIETYIAPWWMTLYVDECVHINIKHIDLLS